MDKTQTVAMMAATIYVAEASGPATTSADVLYQRIAARAWALYDAVETESAQRHSRR